MTPRPMPQLKMSEEDKRNQALQFLAQRRETFSINILCSLLQNNPGINPDDVVEKAVYTADKLMEKLYPIKKDE